MASLRLCWALQGQLDQPTGGYVYDRIVVGGLRARGDRVDLADLAESSELPTHAGDGAPFDAIVGDALCVEALGPAFEGVRRGTARLLLVHHLTSWEVEQKADWSLLAAEARAIAAADRIVVTGEATWERLVAEHPSILGLDVVVPGADRLPRLAVPEREHGALILLFVGSLIPRKRVLLLLDALELVKQRAKQDVAGLALTLVGDATRDAAHAEAIAERIHRSPLLRTSVRVAGVQAEEELAQSMAQSDVLVLPSSLEGYGMVLTEALHAGLPVLVSRETAEAARLQQSPAALVFDDAAGLANEIEALARDGARRAALRTAALATKLPRWGDTVDAFRAAISRAIATARGSGRAP